MEKNESGLGDNVLIHFFFFVFLSRSVILKMIYHAMQKLLVVKIIFGFIINLERYLNISKRRTHNQNKKLTSTTCLI